MPDYHTLMQFEVGGNQRYIFESSRLRDIRGASALLDEVNRTKVQELVDGIEGVDVIRATGGVSVIGFTTDDAAAQNNLEKQIRHLYATEVPGVSLYKGSVLCEGLDVPQMLLALNHATSMDQWAAPGADTHPFVSTSHIKFCSACGFRPGVKSSTLGDTFETVCDVCKAKRDYGGGARRGSIKNSVLNRFFRHVKGNPAWSAYDRWDILPNDLSDIADLSDGELGMVMADGNRLGQTLRQLTSIKEYSQFSRRIAEKVEIAVFNVLSEYTPEKSGDRSIIPWEIIFMGGDDVSLVASADIVLDIGIEIMKQVENTTAEVMQELQRDYLSMAAGVAISPPHFPVRGLYDLSQALEKKSKEKAYELFDAAQTQNASGNERITEEYSTIDFHRITASGNTDLEQVREFELKPLRSSANEKVRMTCRPYTIDECMEVLETARAWREARLPGSKIHYLYDALFQSPASAMFTWAKVVGRSKRHEPQEWKRLEALTSSLDAEKEVVMPWYFERLRTQKGPTRARATYLLDVIDLWSMLPKKPR